MNWLARTWKWLITKTSTAPQLVVVEAEETVEDPAGEMFDWVGREGGVKPRYAEDQKAKFLDTYNGSPDEESVRSGMRQMCESDEVMQYLFRHRSP